MYASREVHKTARIRYEAMDAKEKKAPEVRRHWFCEAALKLVHCFRSRFNANKSLGKLSMLNSTKKRRAGILYTYQNSPSANIMNVHP